MGNRLTEEQRQRVEDNMGLVYFVMNKIPYTQKQWDDYFQSGAYGLCKAARRYDSGDFTNVPFASLACKYIEGAIKHHYRDYERSFFKLPNNAKYSEDTKPKVLSFNKTEKENNDYNYLDEFLQMGSFVNDLIVKMDMDNLIKVLTEREREILNLIYNGVTHEEIGKKFNLSHSGVSKIKNKILERYKNPIVKEKLLLTNKSGFKGVSYNKDNDNWRTTIHYKSKCYNLGSYYDKEVAVKIRQEADKMKKDDIFLEWYATKSFGK